MITINSASAVIIDGQNYGAVCDCIANNPKLAPDIQRALVLYMSVKDDAHSREIISTNKDKEDALALLSANITYQKEAITRAVEAVASGDLKQIQAVLQFAAADFNEKEKLDKAARAAELRAEADAIEADLKD